MSFEQLVDTELLFITGQYYSGRRCPLFDT
jgi:hypothetical protein